MKLKLFIISLALFFTLAGKEAKSQYVFVPDQTGKPLTDARYENINGTPYFVDNWVKGEVKLSNGQLIKPTALKFDMVTDKLLFQADGKTYEFFPRAAAFSLHTENGVKTFLWKDENEKTGSYYELLYDGKIKFLKKVKKNILEVKGYNSANIEKTIDVNKKYFIINNGIETEIKLTKKSLAEALPMHKSKILNYNSTDKNPEQVFIQMLSSLEAI